MQDDQECHAPVGQTGDERGGPQRAVSREGLIRDGCSKVEERLLVPRVRTLRPPHVPTCLEAGVVEPHGAACARRWTNESLTQPGHRADPLGEQPFGDRDLEPRTAVEEQ